MNEAKFYEKIKGKIVQCNLCARYCTILEGKIGRCGVRKNIKGKLYSLVYRKIISTAVDPIEKKPLFHFFPNSRTLSISTVGCNFHCKYCQNWDISQPKKIIGEGYSPKQIVDMAIKYNTQGISYTYTEPTIFYEFAYDTAKLASKKNLYNVFVTNGYITKEPLEEISPYLDAANVDLKSFSDVFYRKLCLVPSYKPVLETIKRMYNLGIHIEITNLMIPTWNDKLTDIRKLVKWIYKLDPNIPLHFSKFYSSYTLMDIPQTPLKILEKAYSIAKEEGLNYVYLGNISTKKSNTYCPKCNSLLIKRVGNKVLSNKTRNGNCFKCNETIPIISLMRKSLNN